MQTPSVVFIRVPTFRLALLGPLQRFLHPHPVERFISCVSKSLHKPKSFCAPQEQTYHEDGWGTLDNHNLFTRVAFLIATAFTFLVAGSNGNLVAVQTSGGIVKVVCNGRVDGIRVFDAGSDYRERVPSFRRPSRRRERLTIPPY